MARSAKGKEIDMEAIARTGEQTVAVGNASMNARGDLIGKGGKIIKTREQLTREYHQNSANSVKNVPISSEVKKMFEKPKQEKLTPIKEEVKKSQKKVEKKGEVKKIETKE